MRKLIVYFMVILLTVSLGIATFYLVENKEIISISSASVYKNVGDYYTIDITRVNKNTKTTIEVSSSDESIASSYYDSSIGVVNGLAKSGGVARINVRTSNSRFRNLWCDIIVGNGTKESPYYISTAEQLAAIGMGDEIIALDENGNEVRTGIYEGAGEYSAYHSNLCYKLVGNINLSEVNNGYWIPLRNFNGRFDGNGFTISNIYIDINGYVEEFGDKADSNFILSRKAGLFESVGAEAVVYNFKMENYMVLGSYDIFGSVSAMNYGTIERIEVKNLNASVKTATYGGIVGINSTTESRQTITDEEGNTTQNWVISTARIDRCSVNQVVGMEDTTVTGLNGTIGGLVGVNNGGTIVYAYANGDIYLADDTIIPVIYGGVIGNNRPVAGLHTEGLNSNANGFEGAKIKDCYSNMRVVLMSELSGVSYVGGVVGVHEDFKNGYVDNDVTQFKVNNYLLGLYYNKDNLNYVQEDISKDFAGIGDFRLDGLKVAFEDKENIVYGLTYDEMKVADNFVSYITKELDIDDEGICHGTVDKEVLWLFGSVWAIDEMTNDGMPYLTYQLSYIDDEFDSEGVPVVPSTMDDFYYVIEVEYPITILSGVDGRVKMTVGDTYQLVYTPVGIDLTWESSDNNVVKVDSNGKLTGVKVGTALITVTTQSGNQATITVEVEPIDYTINTESTIYMYKGTTYDLSNITISPTPSGEDTVTYSLSDANGNPTTLVTLDTTKNILTANSTTTGIAKLTIKVANSVAVVTVAVTEAPSVALTASPNVISGYYVAMTKTGIISITAASTETFKYSFDIVSGGNNIDLSWNSNDSSKLNYSIKGVGETIVRVKISGGVYDGKGQVDILFNILDSLDVTLNLSSTSVTGYYTTMTKTGSIYVSNSANKSVSYIAKSSNTSVVTVSMSGSTLNYTVKGVGPAIVTVSIASDEIYRGTGSVSFNIMEYVQPVESITLSKTSVTLYEGETCTLTATGEYSSLTWDSSNTNVATVSSSGKITAISKGTATITARSAYASATCTVTVQEKSVVYTVSLNTSSVTLYVGNTYSLTATTNCPSLTWSSSKTSVATVSSSGKITAVSAGTATITAKYGTASASCTVTVQEKPVVYTVSLSATSVTIYEGDTYTLTATTNCPSLTWSSSSTSVATVSSSGKITAVSAGTTTITAKYGSVSASCTVTVQEKPIVYTVSLNTSSVTIYEGDTYTLTATTNCPSLTWSSSSTSVATVSSSGKITAVSAGTATITAKYGSVSASCTVTVKEVVPVITYSITLNKANVSLYNSEYITLVASGTYSSVSWSSSNTGVATVSSSGKVTASSSKTGTVTITATAKDANGNAQAYAYCTVTVKAQSSSTVTVSVSASSSHIQVGDTVTLTATTSSGTVTWSVIGNGTIVSKSGNTIVIKATGSGIISVTATISGVSATKSVVVSA